MCDDFMDDFDDPCEDDGYDGLEWQDWMIIGPLSEQIAEEKRERDRIGREHDAPDDDYWDIINRP